MADDSSFESDGRDGGSSDYAEVDLEFATLRRFREEMAPFLNYNGFFVRAEKPFPRGTAVRFRFLLPEGFALAEGTGVVAWSRSKEESRRGEDPGMAVWFEDVSRQSKEVVDELVDFHIATGGKAFEIGSPPEAVGDIPTDALGGSSEPEDDMPLPPPPPASDEAPTPTPGSTDRLDFEHLPEPELPPAAPKGEGVLPDWLSKAEEEKPSEMEAPSEVPRDTIRMETMPPEGGDSETGARPPAASDTSGLEAAIRDMPLGMNDNLEISLMPDGEDADKGSRQEPGADDSTVKRARRERNRPLRDIRLKPLLAVTLILVLCFAGVYWVLTRPARQPLEPIRTIVEVQQEEAAAAGEAPAASTDDAETVHDEGTVGDDEAAGEDTQASAEDLEDVDFELTGEPAAGPEVAADEMVPEELPPAADGTATRLIDVASFMIDNATQVAIRGNGTFLKERVKVTRLEKPARLWIRIQNIGTFYRPNFITVNSPEIEQVRIGHHPEENPQSIYVVLDLADPAAKLRETWLEGDTFRLAVESP